MIHGFYGRLIFLLLWYRVKWIYKVFRLVQGRLVLFGRLLKSQYELLPFGALCNLIAKMDNTSKFGKLDLWMQISFIILFMIDLYKDNYVHAFVCL